MSKRWIAVFAIAVCCLVPLANGSETEDTGVFTADGFMYSLTIGDGWRLDNSECLALGLSGIFMHEGKSYQTSPCLIYPNFGKKKETESLEEFIAWELSKIVGENEQEIEVYPDISVSERVVAVHRGVFDKAHRRWEDIAYILEDTGVVILVLTSSERNAHEQAREQFLNLVKSYRAVKVRPSDLFVGLSRSELELFDQYDALAEANLQSEVGTDYDARAGMYFAQNHGHLIGDCPLDTDESGKAVVLIRLSAAGQVERFLSLPWSSGTECMMQTMMKAQFPKPPADQYWVKMVLSFR